MGAICLHVMISGHVQGVFFRRHAYEQAQTFNVTGWIKNLPDGRVEALICGEPESVELMREWIKHGPPAAKVTNVVVEEVPFEPHPKFEY